MAGAACPLGKTSATLSAEDETPSPAVTVGSNDALVYGPGGDRGEDGLARVRRVVSASRRDVRERGDAGGHREDERDGEAEDGSAHGSSDERPGPRTGPGHPIERVTYWTVMVQPVFAPGRF